MKKLKSKLSNHCILFFLFCLHSACFETTEGCLDIRAANYDVTADDACPDCCTFPVIDINPTYIWDTLSFSLNTKYPLSGDDSIIVRSAHQIISQFDIVSTQSVSYQSIDTADFDNTGYILADLVVLNFATSNPTSRPSIIINDSIQSISFLQDLAAEINDLTNDFSDFDEIEEIVEDSLYDVNGDIFSFYMEFDLINTDTIPYQVSVSAQNFRKDLMFKSIQSIENGDNFVLDLEVDFNILFKDVNFDGIDSITLREQVIINLEDYIELK
jgi:hypothetical protein